MEIENLSNLLPPVSDRIFSVLDFEWSVEGRVMGKTWCMAEPHCNLYLKVESHEICIKSKGKFYFI